MAGFGSPFLFNKKMPNLCSITKINLKSNHLNHIKKILLSCRIFSERFRPTRFLKFSILTTVNKIFLTNIIKCKINHYIFHYEGVGMFVNSLWDEICKINT